jgi:hypothetical protein
MDTVALRKAPVKKNQKENRMLWTEAYLSCLYLEQLAASIVGAST